LAICVINTINLNNSKLTIVSYRQFHHLLNEGEYFLAYSEFVMPVLCETDLTEKQKEYRNNRVKLIQPLVEHRMELFDSRKLSVLTKHEAKGKDISPKTLKRYLRLYFATGCMPSGLIPGFDKCGAPGQEKASLLKLGRKARFETGKALSEWDKRLIKRGFREFYMHNPFSSLSDAYIRTISKYFIPEQSNYDDSDKLRIKIPSKRQFIDWGRKGVSPAQLEERRKGPIIYFKDYQVLKGNANENVYGPGSLYQLDSTKGDIQLVSSLLPNLCIGRPTLYIVTDVYSRMIVGFFLTLENASYVGAAMAFQNSLKDKVELCKEYGVEITHEDWPCSGAPNALLADRGELKGQMSDVLVNNFAINLGITKGYSPDWKGNVERLFRTSQEEIKSKLDKKGAVSKLDNTRIGSDSRSEAVLTLAHLNQILIKNIIIYNKYHYINYYPSTLEMVKDEVDPIPCLLWEYGNKTGLNTTRQVDKHTLYFHLLPRTPLIIDKAGVKFLGEDYTSKDENIRSLLNNILAGKEKGLEIAYDPRNVKVIYLVFKYKYYELTPRKSHLRDMDIFDVIALKEYRSERRANRQKIETLSKAEASQFTDSLVEEASAKRDGKADTKNIRKNRKQDLLEERRKHLPSQSGDVENNPEEFKRKGFDDIIKKVTDDKGKHT
jgi:hypothetical protein